MVQCFNDLPRVRDRTDSFLRRCLIIEFDKCFTGRERKYIKEDYLTRREVLEYVLYRVLTVMPQYYELPVPAACKTAADGFSIANNPVMEFALECLSQLTKYNVFPFEILYILYKNYLKDNNPSSTPLGRNTFISELIRVVQKPPFADEWEYPGRGANNDHIKVPFGYDRGRLCVAPRSLCLPSLSRRRRNSKSPKNNAPAGISMVRCLREHVLFWGP